MDTTIKTNHLAPAGQPDFSAIPFKIPNQERHELLDIQAARTEKFVALQQEERLIQPGKGAKARRLELHSQIQALIDERAATAQKIQGLLPDAYSAAGLALMIFRSTYRSLASARADAEHHKTVIHNTRDTLADLPRHLDGLVLAEIAVEYLEKILASWHWQPMNSLDDMMERWEAIRAEFERDVLAHTAQGYAKGSIAWDAVEQLTYQAKAKIITQPHAWIPTRYADIYRDAPILDDFTQWASLINSYDPDQDPELFGTI